METHIKRLPKVELHAHLSGSVSLKTRMQLQQKVTVVNGGNIGTRENSNSASIAIAVLTNNDRTTKEHDSISEKSADPLGAIRETHHRVVDDLSQCFEVFKQLHALLNNVDAIRYATRQTILEFSEDFVYYLELRTTPRHISTPSDHPSSIKDYVNAVIDGIQDAEKLIVENGSENHAPIITRLILSVDRKDTLFAAQYMITTILSERMTNTRWSQYIVGVDFSGNPLTQPFEVFQQLFETVRKAGLKCTIHCAETLNDEDTKTILAFHPDRLGHMVCLSPSVFELILSDSDRIPIEICPTSNKITKAITELSLHPFGTLYAKDYPITVCTDDCGVFNLSLSDELLLMANEFNLTLQELANMNIRAIKYSFCDQETQEHLHQRMSAASNMLIHTANNPS